MSNREYIRHGGGLAQANLPNLLVFVSTVASLQGRSCANFTLFFHRNDSESLIFEYRHSLGTVSKKNYRPCSQFALGSSSNLYQTLNVVSRY